MATTIQHGPAREVSVRVPPRESASYPVRIGAGAAEAMAEDLSREPLGHRYALIAEETVFHRHGASLEKALARRDIRVERLLFGGGEERKTRSQKRSFENEMLGRELGRDTAIVALGGGVTCDVAGFVAATYHRGIPWVAVPTTLLAMVDAAIGGKVGVNTPHGKNLIGAFHHPSRVYCDPAYLQDLPEREVRSGLAEVAKAALLEGDLRVARLKELAPRLLRREPSAFEEVIEAAVRLKARVVERDETEDDYRQILNVGHTLGHAIEAASRYRLRHGEALAVGLVLEARLGEAVGVCRSALPKEIESLLDSLGLPYGIPDDVDMEEAARLLVRDKKSRGGRPRFAFLERPGCPHRGPEGWAVPVEEEALRRLLHLS